MHYLYIVQLVYFMLMRDYLDVEYLTSFCFAAKRPLDVVDITTN